MSADDLLYAPIGNTEREKMIKRLLTTYGKYNEKVNALVNDDGAVDLFVAIAGQIDDPWAFDLEASLFLNLYWAGSARGTKLFDGKDNP
jgi:hypothetical protein